MKVLVEAHPDIKHDIELLATIDGVAFLTAVIILAELGDLRRFLRARQLTAYAGTSPRITQSGQFRGKTRMCKRGNTKARQALYLSVLSIIRSKHDSDLKRTYQSLVARGHAKKSAIGALMRKLLTVMRAMLIYDTPYQRKRGEQLVTASPNNPHFCLDK
jgi:transposase